MVQKVNKNGLPQEYRRDMKHLVNQHSDICRLRLGNDPPAKVPPMRIKLCSDAETTMVKVGRYPMAQLEILKQRMKKLELLV